MSRSGKRTSKGSQDKCRVSFPEFFSVYYLINLEFLIIVCGTSVSNAVLLHTNCQLSLLYLVISDVILYWSSIFDLLSFILWKKLVNSSEISLQLGSLCNPVPHSILRSECLNKLLRIFLHGRLDSLLHLWIYLIIFKWAQGGEKGRSPGLEKGNALFPRGIPSRSPSWTHL